MPKHTKPWWVCCKCDKPVVRTGKKAKAAMHEHIEVCPLAGFYIKQIEQ